MHALQVSPLTVSMMCAESADCAVSFKRAPGEVADCYLGMLYPTEDFKVYG